MPNCALPLTLLAAALTLAPAALAQDSCRLCLDGAAPVLAGERPLAIEIFTDLAFSRLAMTGSGGGSAAIDAQGGKRTSGAVMDLGGMAVSGSGRITGQPGRAVRIDLPQRVTMSAADGAAAELVDLTTDLPAFPVLDGAGNLEFTFGGRLITGGERGGRLRGRIPITVDYN